MKRIFKKNKLITLFSLILGILITVSALNGIFIAVDAAYNIQDDGMFTEEHEGHTYKFYHINGEVLDELDNVITNPVAVAWGEAASNATGTINIPQTIRSNKPTGANVDYNVIAIRKQGFSRCRFTNVTIPQSIREIGEEAFAYCQYITSIQIPKYITDIAPSTFLDCRELTTVYYSRSDGTASTTNSTIRTFGDHAFDSCVKLDSIQCPSSAIFFGESCFQKTNFNTFRLPYDNGYADVEHGRNEITIEKYAFADCPVLQNIYFDVNTTMIEDYAFADSKTDLTFYYCGHEIPTFAGNPLWRNKKITTNPSYSSQVYNVIVDQEKLNPSTEYPGLFYYFSSNDVPLDNARTTGTSNTTSVYVIQNSTEYAVIANFETPNSADWRAGYYEAGGILTIPNEIEGRPVKVIANNAFQQHSDLTEVHLNSNLVQIQHHAFYHSNNIALLDFSACTNLLEISYNIFNEIVLKSGVDVNNAINNDKDDNASKAETNINRAMTTITFPNCLRYIGNFAFFNFGALEQTYDGSGNIVNPGISFKTNPSEPSDLRIIGDYAFANYNESVAKKGGSAIGTNGTIDLVLPYTLSDTDSAQANIFHAFAYDRKYNANQSRSTVHEAFINRYSVNRNAFEYQNALRSVRMERGGTPHETSFASNSFARCPGIVRFESNANICLIGKDIFKNDKHDCQLREVFLEADTAQNNSYGVNTPWNIFDGSNVQDTGSTLFSGSKNSKEVVVYIKSTNNQPPKNQYYWSYELTGLYGNGLGGTRKGVPIHFVDWTVAGNIKYWHLNGSANSLISMDISNNVYGPLTPAEYNDGYISFAKKSNGNYSVARYFSNGTNKADTVDLTSNTLNGMTIDVIGEEAFAGDKNLGIYFVFPTSVTTVKERAFQRNDASGVRIVTFKNGANIQVPTNSSDTFAQCVSAGENKAYCCLSNNLTRVELDAFYNNKFKKIELGTSLAYIGLSAFYRNKSQDGKSESYLFTDYDSGTNPDANAYFTVINNGIYYTGGGVNKKVLIYQPQNLTGTLTIDTDTKAISIRAAANSKYSEVDFIDEVIKVYGQAFMNCTALETLSNVSALKYIGSGVNTPDAEWITESTPTCISTLENATKGGTSNYLSMSCFEGCSNLKVDFSEFTSLVKIGESCFKGCTNLVKFQLSKNYKIYKCTDGSTIGSPIATYDDANGGVLDLSLCPTLRSLYKSPFSGCTSAKYAITPNTTPSYTGESSMTMAGGQIFDGSTKVLCGETIDQADQTSRVSGNKATTHYNNGTLGGYSNLYFRAHSTADLHPNYPTGRFYWTAIQNGSDPSEANDYKIILFETYNAANTWFSNAANVASQLP